MKIQIDLEYRTAYGENLVLKAGDKKYEMKYICSGLWRLCLDRVDFEEYSFEVEREGETIRTEVSPHYLGLEGYSSKVSNTIYVNDYWHDRPSDSSFHSKMFTDVVFRRDLNQKVSKAKKRTTKKAKKVKKDFPTLVLSFIEAKVRPEWTLGVIGSGEMFSDWSTPIVMDETHFPEWTVSLNPKENFEYKFVVLDRKTNEILFWEETQNHVFVMPSEKGITLVEKKLAPVFYFPAWKCAGTAIPLFSLRTADDFGIGEFNDIKKLVDWAVATNQSIIQLLPINDTENTGTWVDSYPYNANSAFALHPQFMHLPDIGVRRTKEYKKQQEELNSLPSVDYEKVNELKKKYITSSFKSKWSKVSASADFKKFVEKEKDWLLPYALYSVLRDKTGTTDFSQWGKFETFSNKLLKEGLKKYNKEANYYIYTQYCLNKQLIEVVEYAHSKGVALKGDLPIGVSRTSADVWSKSELFNLTGQAGAPPDDFAANGQNWGFPTYNWAKMSEDGFAWWRARMSKMSEFFDAFRIDHILGFFRIWEIPSEFVTGLSGHFSPAMPYSADELSGRGFDINSGLYTHPRLEGWVIDEIFGDLASLVWDKFITYGHLIDEVSTQKKAVAFRDSLDDFVLGADREADANGNKPCLSEEQKDRLMYGFMRIADDVLFVEDPYKQGYYHPRISAHSSFSYRMLFDNQKNSFNELYDDFFYHRHDQFWRESAMSKLTSLLSSSNMLVCGEDLGMIPNCVPQTMQDMNILSLEVQRMPKPDSAVKRVYYDGTKKEFAETWAYPYYSVGTTGTHDMSTLRGWWEEDRRVSEAYYHNVLGRHDIFPYFCEPYVATDIINQHLYSPSMLIVLPMQDWLATDGTIRLDGNPDAERINIPAIPRHYWRYRMHLSLEDLLKEKNFNNKLKDMIASSGR